MTLVNTPEFTQVGFFVRCARSTVVARVVAFYLIYPSFFVLPFYKTLTIIISMYDMYISYSYTLLLSSLLLSILIFKGVKG